MWKEKLLFRFLIVFVLLFQFIHADQKMVVLTPSWDAIDGKLYLFEDEKLIKGPIPVKVGKKGMAWGIGLDVIPQDGPIKKEGDLKSPAGVFTLGTSFGFEKIEDLKIPYLQLNENIEAVDDPNSHYYNQIVNNNDVAIKDWNSSEKMREIGVYELGLVVNHNRENIPGKGSAIFMHLLENNGTAGCTAMDRENMDFILHWLDKDKNPILIQMPQPIYDNCTKSFYSKITH